MENIIILRTPYKITKAYLTPCRDPRTGRYPECVRATDSKGDMIMTEADRNSGKYFIKDIDVIEIEDGKVFDLDDEIQAIEWEAIKYHKFIAKARDERDEKGNLVIDGDAKKYGTAEWYVENPGMESKSKNASRRKRIDAQNYIINDSPEERLLKARVLGKSLKNAHDSDVEDYLMQEAEKHPDKIINLYTGGDMQLRILFLKAKDEKIIMMKDKIWMYGDTILGASDESAISWMKQPINKKMLQLLQQEVYPEMFEQKKNNK